MTLIVILDCVKSLAFGDFDGLGLLLVARMLGRQKCSATVVTLCADLHGSNFWFPYVNYHLCNISPMSVSCTLLWFRAEQRAEDGRWTWALG